LGYILTFLLCAPSDLESVRSSDFYAYFY